MEGVEEVDMGVGFVDGGVEEGLLNKKSST